VAVLEGQYRRWSHASPQWTGILLGKEFRRRERSRAVVLLAYVRSATQQGEGSCGCGSQLLFIGLCNSLSLRGRDELLTQCFAGAFEWQSKSKTSLLKRMELSPCKGIEEYDRTCG
jgi:hypothetical protein